MKQPMNDIDESARVRMAGLGGRDGDPARDDWLWLVTHIRGRICISQPIRLRSSRPRQGWRRCSIRAKSPNGIIARTGSKADVICSIEVLGRPSRRKLPCGQANSTTQTLGTIDDGGEMLMPLPRDTKLTRRCRSHRGIPHSNQSQQDVPRAVGICFG